MPRGHALFGGGPRGDCPMNADEGYRPALVEGKVYSRPAQAVILAGGRGTRMRPLTDTVPKRMVPVLNRPFLEFQIEQLRDSGFTKVQLLLGYLPDVVM